MSKDSQRGQAMVEMALGVSIFLLAAMGAVQLGLSALTEDSAQSAALIGARIASSAPITGADPLTRLDQGQAEALAALRYGSVGLARATDCSSSIPGGCGSASSCVLYQDGTPVAGSAAPCSAVTVASDPSKGYGPAPDELDGGLNPRCHRGGCFGSSSTMSACSRQPAPGQLRVCLAYSGWPPTAVDIWVRGSLRTLLPWPGATGFDTLPVDVRLRLQVERFTS